MVYDTVGVAQLFFFFEIKPHKLQAISRIQQRRAELWHLEPGWGGGVKLWAPSKPPAPSPRRLVECIGLLRIF